MLDEKRQRYLVGLFARSRVEIMLSTVWKSRIRSTSSRGRELKYSNADLERPLASVDLFARSRVEIIADLLVSDNS